MNYKALNKTLLIITSIFLVKLMAGCIFRCQCPDVKILDLTFNKSIIKAIDNSDNYIQYIQTADSIPNKAVGFEIEIMDSSYIDEYSYELYAQTKSPILLGFKGAYAWQCYCNYYDYRPTKTIENISLITLFDFSEDYPAQTDISSLFLGYIDRYDFDNKNLYSNVNQILKYYNAFDPLESSSIKFEIYLTKPVMNDSLQLEITFEFDDNSFLSDTTSVVYTINNAK